MKRLPEWALRDENYSPDSDNDYFISRTLLRIMKILRALRYRARKNRIENFSAASAILFTVSLIFLCVISRTTNFLFCVLALELILLCPVDGETIFSTVRNSVAAAVFAALFLLPAFFFGNPNLILILPFKIFLTTTALGLLTIFFTENQLTRALKNFRVPAVMIFILDTTLRYIVLLGEISQDMLTALKIRSVGKNRDKKKIRVRNFGNGIFEVERNVGGNVHGDALPLFHRRIFEFGEKFFPTGRFNFRDSACGLRRTVFIFGRRD